MPTTRFSTISTIPMPCLPPSVVQLADDVGNLHLLAVYAGRNAFLKGHGNVLALIRGFLRGNAQDQKVIVVGLVCRILQLQALMADVPQVTVAAVAAVGGRREGRCRAALQYSISSSRDCMVQISVIRHGAMIFMSGASALMPSSKRIWSLPLPVAPWQMATAPSFLAISTRRFAMAGTGHGGS